MTTTYYSDSAGSNTAPYDTWVKAATSIQTVADLAVAGDIVYARGTQTLAAPIDIDTNPGDVTDGFIKFIGCAAGGSVDGTWFVLNGDSAAANCLKETGGIDYIWIENFEFKNATADGFTWSTTYPDRWVVINCYSHDNVGSGFQLYRGIGRNSEFIRCLAESNGEDGFEYPYSGQHFFFCEAKLNSQDGWSLAGGSTFIGCISHNNTWKGIDCDGGDASVIFNCVVDENEDDGIEMDDGIILGSRITDNNDGGVDTHYGIVVNASMTALYGWCYLDNPDADGETGGNLLYAIPYNSVADTNETSGTEGYNDGGADDFNLTDSATLRSTAIALD